MPGEFTCQAYLQSPIDNFFAAAGLLARPWPHQAGVAEQTRRRPRNEALEFQLAGESREAAMTFAAQLFI